MQNEFAKSSNIKKNCQIVELVDFLAEIEKGKVLVVQCVCLNIGAARPRKSLLNRALKNNRRRAGLPLAAVPVF